MRIGVLALQGAFIEHITILQQLGAEAVPVRLPQELEGLDGLVIPGGERSYIPAPATKWRKCEMDMSACRMQPDYITNSGPITSSNEVFFDEARVELALDKAGVAEEVAQIHKLHRQRQQQPHAHED